MASAIAWYASPAFAHTGTGLAGGFGAGFTHPFGGMDHLLAMISVGLWGAILGEPLVFLLPVVFPGLMVLGAIVAAVGMAAGAAAILGGVVAIVRGGAAGSSSAVQRSPGWLALGLLAGAVLPVQGAVNGLLRIDIGAPLAVATVSFVVATLAMFVVVLGIGLRTGSISKGATGFGVMPWWGWLVIVRCRWVTVAAPVTRRGAPKRLNNAVR